MYSETSPRYFNRSTSVKVNGSKGDNEDKHSIGGETKNEKRLKQENNRGNELQYVA